MITIQFHVAAWGWPQYVYLFVVLLVVGTSIGNHGKPKIQANGEPFSWNAYLTIYIHVVAILILQQGGFF